MAGITTITINSELPSTIVKGSLIVGSEDILNSVNKIESEVNRVKFGYIVTFIYDPQVESYEGDILMGDIIKAFEEGGKIKFEFYYNEDGFLPGNLYMWMQDYTQQASDGLIEIGASPMLTNLVLDHNNAASRVSISGFAQDYPRLGWVESL